MKIKMVMETAMLIEVIIIKAVEVIEVADMVCGWKKFCSLFVIRQTS